MIGNTVVGNSATSAAAWFPAANERQCERARWSTRPTQVAAEPPTSWRRITRLASVATASATK